jgi:hypothetical protein
LRGQAPAADASAQPVAILTDQLAAMSFQHQHWARQACRVGCRSASRSARTGPAGSLSGPQRPHHSLGPGPHASGSDEPR